MQSVLTTISVVIGILVSNIDTVQAQNRCVHCNMDIEAVLFISKATYHTHKEVEFDAIECLVNYLKGKDDKEFKQLWVTDYSTGKLLKAEQAYFLKSKKLPSPMGAFLTAYDSEDSAELQKQQFGGEIYNWEELRERFVNSNFGSNLDIHHHHGINGYGPAGISGDHLHPKGGLMITAKHMYMRMDGNRQGNDKISDDLIYESFMVAPQQMNMHMSMLGIMYAPSDQVTLIAMQDLVWKDMDLTARMTMGNGMPMFNDFKTSSSVLGDMKLSVLIGLLSKPKASLHLNTGLNIPIGEIQNRDATPMMADAKLPYAMQLGTGTLDFRFGATFRSDSGHWSYGVQQLNTIRTGENSEGYRFGNTYELNTWLAFRFTNTFNATIRVSASAQGSINGSDNELNPMMVTTADTSNYGGELIRGALGANILLFRNALILGVEMITPIYRNYNGIQMDERWGVNSSLRYTVL